MSSSPSCLPHRPADPEMAEMAPQTIPSISHVWATVEHPLASVRRCLERHAIAYHLTGEGSNLIRFTRQQKLPGGYLRLNPNWLTGGLWLASWPGEREFRIHTPMQSYATPALDKARMEVLGRTIKDNLRNHSLDPDGTPTPRPETRKELIHRMAITTIDEHNIAWPREGHFAEACRAIARKFPLDACLLLFQPFGLFPRLNRDMDDQTKQFVSLHPMIAVEDDLIRPYNHCIRIRRAPSFECCPGLGVIVWAPAIPSADRLTKRVTARDKLHPEYNRFRHWTSFDLADPNDLLNFVKFILRQDDYEHDFGPSDVLQEEIMADPWCYDNDVPAPNTTRRFVRARILLSKDMDMLGIPKADRPSPPKTDFPSMDQPWPTSDMEYQRSLSLACRLKMRLGVKTLREQQEEEALKQSGGDLEEFEDEV